MTVSPDEFSERRPYNAVTDFVDANVARGLGAKTAFTDGARTLPYGELQDATCRFAGALSALGLRQESRLAVGAWFRLCCHSRNAARRRELRGGPAAGSCEPCYSAGKGTWGRAAVILQSNMTGGADIGMQEPLHVEARIAVAGPSAGDYDRPG